MSSSRRHHFVSQFYLRNFAADPANAMLFVVDLPQRKAFTAPPQAVAFENDFHTIETPDYPPDIVETALADLEGSVATAVRNTVANGGFREDEDRLLILFFATLLLLKSPTVRKIMNEMVNKVMNMMGKMDASKKDTFEAKVRRHIAEGGMPSDTDIEGLRKQILTGDYTINLSTAALLHLEFANIMPLFTQCVAPRNWNIYRATAGQFITSDRPAVLMWADAEKNEPIGLGLPGTRLLFPLSSDLAILGGFELDNATLEVGAEEVAKINGNIIANCKRQVYARDENFEYAVRHNAGVKRGVDLRDDQIAVDFAEQHAPDG